PVTFTVTATSTAGASAPSPASAPVTPEPVAAPRDVLRGRPQPVAYDKYSLIIGGVYNFAVAAADQWLSEVDPIIAAHQITRGGDVIMYQIENEYGYTDPLGEAYFGDLEAQAKADGIDLPTYTNDVGSYANGWAPGTPDAPDLIGSDQYPEGFDCSNPTVFNSPPVLTGDHEPGIPLMVPEYQGGSFDSWAAPATPAARS
ncbi:MAG: beta-galactosidase, partial [Solirubrobacteraceae bacterium]